MKVLLSSIGSRGDTQPMLAFATELRTLGHEAILCVPPTFSAWVESLGFRCVPVGRDVRALVMPKRDELRALVPETVREQFRVLLLAAKDCDHIVALGALQVAARSIAEHRNIPYTYATFCPVTLASDDHAPPLVREQRHSREENRALWNEHRASVNALFAPTVDEERGALGLPPIDDVEHHVFTDHPIVAADGALAPSSHEHTGAWLLEDPSELPEDLERFLSNGEPPIYVGLGSMRGTTSSAALLEAARSVGARIVLSRGWAGLESDGGSDCIAIGDVDHRKLFPRVRAIVHHGGAGTTTTAALSGRPQFIVPHNYDQFYWRERVVALGIGGRTLEEALAMTKNAEAFAPRISKDGARRAALRVTLPSSRAL